MEEAGPAAALAAEATRLGPLITQVGEQKPFHRVDALPGSTVEGVLYVTDPDNIKGKISLSGGGTLVLVNDGRQAINGKFKIAEGSTAFVFAPVSGLLNLTSVVMAAGDQLLFWGDGATSVGTTLAMVGTGARMAIGDDCMFHSGVSIRNSDMHAIVSESGQWLNQDVPDVFVEQHVWLGQETALNGAERVGYGCVVGARSLLVTAAPAMSILAGVPARVLRKGVTWERSFGPMSKRTRQRLDQLHQQAAATETGGD